MTALVPLVRARFSFSGSMLHGDVVLNIAVVADDDVRVDVHALPDPALLSDSRALADLRLARGLRAVADDGVLRDLRRREDLHRHGGASPGPDFKLVRERMPPARKGPRSQNVVGGPNLHYRRHKCIPEIRSATSRTRFTRNATSSSMERLKMSTALSKHSRTRGDRHGIRIADPTPKPPIDAWIELVSNSTLLLDLGSGEHGGFHLSSEARIVKIDIQRRFGPDVVADAQTLPFRDACFDNALAMSVLEHVPRPWEVVEEIRRVLRSGGHVLGYVPYMWPYHADSTFRDYFRFSEDAISALFSSFSSVEILAAGGYTNAILRFLSGFTASQRHLLRWERLVAGILGGLARSTGIADTVRVRGLRRTTTGYNFLARK